MVAVQASAEGTRVAVAAAATAVADKVARTLSWVGLVDLTDTETGYMRAAGYTGFAQIQILFAVE